MKVLTLQEVEKRHIENVLKRFNNNKMKAAEALDITVKTLYNRLWAYGLYDKYCSQNKGVANEDSSISR